MSSPRRTQHERPHSGGSSDLQLSTLLIAAAASAAAAFVTSQVWAGGTLWAAAASPVIVALVKEGLRHPATRLQTVRRDVSGRIIRGPQLPGAPDSGPLRRGQRQGGDPETGPVRV